MNLALKYRPQTFSDVVGQKVNSVILNAMMQKKALSQVLLFTGPSGTGKTTMARIVAAELNPDDKDAVHAGVHPAVIEIDGASNGSVEAIRQLKRDLNFVTLGWRVVIIDEVHAISDEAKAALLNLLEFPPAKVTFILITTETHKIPKTVRHRCDHYPFKIASIDDLVQRLSFVNSEEGFQMSDELLNLIAQRSEGSYRESMMLIEQASVAGIRTVEQYNKLQGEVDFGPVLISSALYGPPSALGKLESILRYSNAEEVFNRTVETLKDLMLLKGNIPLTHTGAALDSRMSLAAKLGTDQILKSMRILWDLETKLGVGDSVRNLELAFSLIADAVKQEELPLPPVGMSLDAMRKYSG